MRYHYTSNWLGEPMVVRIYADTDTEYERMREEIEVQNALDAQLKLFPRAEQGAQREEVA